VTRRGFAALRGSGLLSAARGIGTTGVTASSASRNTGVPGRGCFPRSPTGAPRAAARIGTRDEQRRSKEQPGYETVDGWHALRPSLRHPTPLGSRRMESSVRMPAF